MRHICLLPLLALGACATVPPPAPIDTPPAETTATCRPTDLSRFIGQPQSAALDKSLRDATGAKTVRWVARGMMVTMDFRDDRLTVYLDAANRIERASCG